MRTPLATAGKLFGFGFRSRSGFRPPNGCGFFVGLLLPYYYYCSLSFFTFTLLVPHVPPTSATTTTTFLALDEETTTVKSPLIHQDFPDPSLVQDTDGTWYAFATAGGSSGSSSGVLNIQVAQAASPAGPWTYLDDVDPLPDTGNWTDGSDSWAPDVRVIASGRYVMYYSGEVIRNNITTSTTSNSNSTTTNSSDTSNGVPGRYHCIGVATATAVLGPYAPAATPFACPAAQGGAIDPAGFLDTTTGRRYVVYKVDGNNVGNGGSCNNGVAPYVATPIVLQEVSAADGVTPVGSGSGGPVQLLDRTEADGPLVEAPNLVWLDGEGDGGNGSDGIYVLFYSSHCFDSSEYNVNYATATNITGPYTRSASPLIATGDFNTTAPGGATSVDGGGSMVFHANCDGGRCMFGATFTVTGTNVTVGRKRRRRPPPPPPPPVIPRSMT